MNETPLQPPEWCRVRAGEEQDIIALRMPLRARLREYVELGVPQGGFMEAVIASDLFEAAGRADHINKHWLWEYAYWLYNYAPSACCGSEAAYHEWLALHAAARHWRRNPPQLGQRVRTLAALSEVPIGSEGVIDEKYDNGGLMVAWDLPGNAFSLEELRFLTPVDEP